ncbi:MAG TPA: CotH kinase family protein [Bacteroidales bacterium]|nr:CotH kinase family protein [Bacteroidales bacterium]
MKKFFILITLLFFGNNIVKAQVFINEYSCSNVSSFADNFGQYEDWVEIYNPGGVSVSLDGWYLSDKKTNPAKWKITSATIPSHGFLRIWASGRDIKTGTLHAGFKLTQCLPEAIVIADASGDIVDSVTLKPTQEGHSRGRSTNGAATWSVFPNPTPNASNTNPYSEYAARPMMSVAAGFYSSTQSVTITSPDPSITIRYTTNGSMPTAASVAYTGPVTISTTTVLRARAFSSSSTVPASFVESNTYFINSSHTIEVVSIYGDAIMALMNGTQSSPYTGVEYYDHNGQFVTESYGNSNKHGNDSWAYDQRGIDFVSHDQYGYNYALEGQLFNSKPRTEFQHIIFKAAANDNYPFSTSGSAHIRDSYVHTLSQKAHLHMDERTWAPCVMYVNGQYWGVYDTREKVDDKDFMEYYHDTKEDSLQMLKTWGGTWSEYGGAQAQTDWNNLRNFITSNNMAIPANYHYVDSVYSIKSLTDYVILNSFSVCSDWLNWNTIWWRGLNENADKKKWRYCLWDEDATFNHYINYTGIPNTNTNADPCDPNSLSNPGGQGHIPVLNALLQNPDFYQYYIMRYFDLLNGPMKCSRMTDLLDSMITVIQPEMQQHINRWGGTYNEWWANYQTLRTFIQDRCTQVVQLFDNCWPVTGPFPIVVDISPHGSGTVTLNSLDLTSFAWSGQYPGNMTILMTAHPGQNFCFDHWEFQHHTPSPGINDTAVSFLFTTGDTVIAHFSPGGPPGVTATPSSICSGDTTLLQVSSGTDFSWSPATGLSCTDCASPLASPTVTTTYMVSASGGCVSGTAEVTVTVTPYGTLFPTVSASFSTICAGDTAALHVSTGNTFQWTPATGLSCTDCADPLASPVTTTTYTVQVTGDCGSGTASVKITIMPPPQLILSGDTSVCLHGRVRLAASGGLTYVWIPSDGLSCDNCADPYATPVMTTAYSVVASNGPGEGCRDTGMITVTVTDVCPDLFIPTGFSPNGDNNNDVYYIFGDLEQIELVIYDRWGHIVFETNDQSIGWDGSCDGKDVMSGIYAYKLKYTDRQGIVAEKSGNITLVR